MSREKCCEEYGNKITDMLNKKLFKCNEAKSHRVFLHRLSSFLFKITGNVNATMRLNHIGSGYGISHLTNQPQDKERA